MKKIEEYINKNKVILEKALEIDNKKWNENKEIDEILKYQNLNIELEERKTYLLIYDGEPNITRTILEEAINKCSNIVFIENDYYLAVNTIFLEIANKLIKENNIKIFLKLYNNIKEEKVFQNSKSVDATIYIGDENNFDYIRNHIYGNLIKIKYE